MKYIVLILYTLVLTACGGGGGTASTASVVSSNNSVVITPTTPDPTQTTLSYSNNIETVIVTDTVTNAVISTTTNSATGSSTVTNGLTKTTTYNFADGSTNIVTTQIAPLALTTVHNISALIPGTNTNTGYGNAVGDLNGDGLDDVVVGGWNWNNPNTMTHVPAYLHVFLQNTDHTLTDVTATVFPAGSYGGSNSILIADFNNDSKPDILVPGYGDGSAQYYEPTFILWNNGTDSNGNLLQFTQTQVSVNPNLAAQGCVADINNDGYLDFIAGGFNGTNTQFGATINTSGGIFINNGDGSAGHPSTFTLRVDLNANLNNTYYSSCAIMKNGNYINIALGSNNINQGNIFTFSVNPAHVISYVSSAPVPSHDTTNAINALAVDVNHDGVTDLIMMYNGPNAKEVYLGSANNTFSYSSTLDTLGNDYAYVTTINGYNSILFASPAYNGVSQDAIYHLTSNNVSAYTPVVNFATMATSVVNGAATADCAVIYHDNTGRTFMLQLLNNTFYTQEMQ